MPTRSCCHNRTYLHGTLLKHELPALFLQLLVHAFHGLTMGLHRALAVASTPEQSFRECDGCCNLVEAVASIKLTVDGGRR